LFNQFAKVGYLPRLNVMLLLSIKLFIDDIAFCFP
jgi:hypothetical protein